MQKNHTIKERSGNWIHLLQYDMAMMVNTEKEFQKQLPAWIKETSSTQLSIILQKSMIFAAHHSLALENFLQGARVSIAGQHQNIIKLFSGDLREKLKYCNSRRETDHCIWANITYINKLKLCHYQHLLQTANEIEQTETARFFSTAAENESRLNQWMTDYNSQRIEPKKNYYLML